MISNPISGSLTQGTVFNCALAEDYPDKDVLGIVVTARCDVANDKVDTYNYIPLVRYEDWCLQDGCRILSSRIVPSAFGEMKRILVEADLAESMLSTISPSLILNSIFRHPDVEAPLRKLEPRFARAESRYSSALQETLFEGSDSDRLAFLKANPRDFGALAKELVHNSLAEYYYLRASYPGELCRGYVALLREMRHIPRALATAIVGGLDLPSYTALCADGRNAKRLAITTNDHFAMPIGLVLSPHIELLLQRFTMLFSRIGVADPDPTLLPYLQSIINAEQ